MTTQTHTTGQEYFLTSGIHQDHLLTIPEEGLLVRLRVDDERLSASLEEGSKQPSMSSSAFPIIAWALAQIQVKRLGSR
jgi:hypothetical protein